MLLLHSIVNTDVMPLVFFFSQSLLEPRLASESRFSCLGLLSIEITKHTSALG